MNRQLQLIAQPRARHDSPPTSRVAAKSVEPAAGELEREIRVVVAVANSGSLGYLPTAESIARGVERRFPGRWAEGTIRSAVSRCAARGRIVTVGTGKTSRGREASTYRSAP